YAWWQRIALCLRSVGTGPGGRVRCSSPPGRRPLRSTSVDGPGVPAGQQVREFTFPTLGARIGDLLVQQVVIGGATHITEHTDRYVLERRLVQTGQCERVPGVFSMGVVPDHLVPVGFGDLSHFQLTELPGEDTAVLTQRQGLAVLHAQ